MEQTNRVLTRVLGERDPLQNKMRQRAVELCNSFQLLETNDDDEDNGNAQDGNATNEDEDNEHTTVQYHRRRLNKRQRQRRRQQLIAHDSDNDNEEPNNTTTHNDLCNVNVKTMRNEKYEHDAGINDHYINDLQHECNTHEMYADADECCFDDCSYGIIRIRSTYNNP